MPSFDPLVPVIFHGRALREDDNRVDDAGDSVESNETPEEGFPFLAFDTAHNSISQCHKKANNVINWAGRTHKSLFRNKLIEILRKMVEKIRKNSVIRSNLMLNAARIGFNVSKC